MLMKKSSAFLLAFIIGITILTAVSCKQKSEIDYASMHVYSPQELQMIIDNAYKIERVGEPLIQKTTRSKDSSIVTITSQVYRVYAGRTDDNHLIPPSKVTESARMAGGNGPIIITSSCEMTCTPVRQGESCNISGCIPTDKCG